MTLTDPSLDVCLCCVIDAYHVFAYHNQEIMIKNNTP